MPKRTDVRVKRTDAWACVRLDGTIRHDGCEYWIYCHEPTDAEPCTIIDRRDLRDLEARLKAADAECKRLRKAMIEIERDADTFKEVICIARKALKQTTPPGSG